MGIEIRRFPSIDAFSRCSGTAIACSTGLFLELAKQLLDSTAAASGRGRASVGGGVAAGPWRRLEKAPLTPRITRFLVPANKRGCGTYLAVFVPVACRSPAPVVDVRERFHCACIPESMSCFRRRQRVPSPRSCRCR